MPFATRPTIVWRVMFSPSNVTLPAVGGKKPLMRLKKVVLPAPFGPITARSSPAFMSNVTPSTAFNVPKWRDTLSIRKNVDPAGAGLAIEDAEHAFREQEHDEHEEQADEGHPVFGHARQIVLSDDEDDHPEQRPKEAAHASEHDHDHEVAGQDPMQVLRRRKVEQHRVERSGKRRNETRDRKGCPHVTVNPHTEEFDTPAILADRHPG